MSRTADTSTEEEGKNEMKVDNMGTTEGKASRPRSQSTNQHEWENDVAEVIRKRIAELRTEQQRQQKKQRAPQQPGEEQDDSASADKLTRPLMVGLVGPPGSGKGVGALIVADMLHQCGIEAAIIPHNGTWK